MKDMIFYDDVYLYDLNLPESPPLAWRCADGGLPQPDLPTLLGLSMREWLQRERTIYQSPISVVADRCAVVLPLSGRIGRLAVATGRCRSGRPDNTHTCTASAEILQGRFAIGARTMTRIARIA